MKTFSESLRYDYQLNSDSLVVDVGAFDGNFARSIASLYGCRVVAFEPVRKHFIEAVCNCNTLPNVCLINSALEYAGSTKTISVRSNSSSFYNQAEDHEEVSIVRAVPFFKAVGNVDVLKINAEGSEYGILATLVNTGLIRQIANVQVQFHDNVPDWKDRYEDLKTQLGKTHEQEWSSWFAWENYRQK